MFLCGLVASAKYMAEEKDTSHGFCILQFLLVLSTTMMLFA